MSEEFKKGALLFFRVLTLWAFVQWIISIFVALGSVYIIIPFWVHAAAWLLLSLISAGLILWLYKLEIFNSYGFGAFTVMVLCLDYGILRLVLRLLNISL